MSNLPYDSPEPYLANTPWKPARLHKVLGDQLSFQSEQAQGCQEGAPLTWKTCVQVGLGSKVPNYRVRRDSILGIVIMVLGRYLIVGYLDL